MKPFVHHHIIGIGRSGTTLLQSLLNTHPQVWAGPENYFIPFFYRAYQHKKEFTEKDLTRMNRFHRSFGVLQPYIGFRFNSERFLALRENLHSFQDLIQSTYSCFEDTLNSESDFEVYINKNPIHSMHLSDLIALDPSSKFIWMVRDYRANIHSRKHSVHLKSTNALENVVRWNQFDANIRRFAEQFPERVLLVRYEDLVTNCDTEWNRIIDFLGLDPFPNYKAALVPYQRAYEAEVRNRFPRAKRMIKRFGDLSKPINTEATERWREGLTRNEIEKCEALAGKRGLRYGYIPSLSILPYRRLIYQGMAVGFRLKVHFTAVKDFLFHRLPIGVKVWYFERWVERIDAKRRRDVEF
ncbi:MAG: sulfotransferase family protein [Flavobacteriales bacterium]